MEKETYITHSPEKTQDLAHQCVDELFGGDILLLSGDLGAGKTTFVQALLAHLGAEGPFTSPTFSVIKMYDLPADESGESSKFTKVYHIDAYRIDEQDLLELGWAEMILDQDALIVVEWPEKVLGQLPAHAKKISFEALSACEREITFSL